MTFQIAAGAEKPSVTFGFLVDDAPANLAGYGSVTFRMRSANGTAWTVSAAGTVTSESGGSVRYDWSSGNTATAGDYAAHFVVHYASTELTSPEFPVRVFALAPAGAAARRVRHLLDDAAADLFTDQDVEDALGQHATVLLDEPLHPREQVRSGTVEWVVYESSYAWLDEAVTVRNASGTAAPAFTLDPGPGRFTFAANTFGSAYYVSGTAYEPALAAADLAERLAARYARDYDFDSDGSSFKRSQRAAAWRSLADQLRSSAARPIVAEVVRLDAPC